MTSAGRSKSCPNAQIRNLCEPLEDHDCCVGDFSRSASIPDLPIHAVAFARTFGAEMNHDAVAAALLAADDYTDRGYVVRRLVPARQHDRRWREVITHTTAQRIISCCERLHAVCPSYRNPDEAPERALKQFLGTALPRRAPAANCLDWRFYFTAHSSMRVRLPLFAGKGRWRSSHGHAVRRHHNVEMAY